MHQTISFIGLGVVILTAYLLSDNKKKINWKMVAICMILQLIFAGIVLGTKLGKSIFLSLNDFAAAVLKFSSEGAAFIFGSLVTNVDSFGFIFAFQVLPTIIFISALMQILYYYGIMQKVIEVLAKMVMKVMGTSGAETLCACANIFMGHTESPLMIKPYVEKLTKSELFAVMTGGFATISAGVFAAYAGMLASNFPAAAGHILAACLMSAPASLMIAKIMIPETETPQTAGSSKLSTKKTDVNAIDAAANGASVGLHLALNVAGMLIAFIAIIALLDGALGLIGSIMNNVFGTHIILNLETIFGLVFWPISYLLGIPAHECSTAGNILAQHIVLNEFVAYSTLSETLRTVSLSPRTVTILTYAICSFANISSIAIQIAGIGSIAPSRKADLAKLGVPALIAGILTSYLTATIAGILTP